MTATDSNHGPTTRAPHAIQNGIGSSAAIFAHPGDSIRPQFLSNGMRDLHKLVGERIRLASKEAGLYQTAGAKLLKRTQSYVSEVESGRRGFDVVELDNVLGKPITYFIQEQVFIGRQSDESEIRFLNLPLTLPAWNS